VAKSILDLVEWPVDRPGFEFPFDLSDDAGADRVVGRLDEIRAVAAKLRDAGWTIWLTVTGLAFDPPGEWCELFDPETSVRDRLADLGVREPFTWETGRTPAEVRQASREADERLRHERRLNYLRHPHYDGPKAMSERPEETRELLRAVHRAEQAGLETKFPMNTKFNRGVVCGKSSALRFVLGEEDPRDL
jgi:hypothetical protein